jgi:hypothetical protein
MSYIIKKVKKREELIEKAEEKVGKIPERYVPESLTIQDLRKQLKNIIEGVKRPQLKTFKIEGTKQDTKFEKEMKELNFNPDLYIKVARIKAKNYGLNPDKLNFSNEIDKKLNYDGVNFGATGYNDFIIYNFMEMNGDIPEGTANEKMKLYRNRAESIKGNWKKDKISPNNLAINILW